MLHLLQVCEDVQSHQQMHLLKYCVVKYERMLCVVVGVGVCVLTQCGD